MINLCFYQLNYKKKYIDKDEKNEKNEKNEKDCGELETLMVSTIIDSHFNDSK